MKRKSICLSMIVKNESRVIQRSLGSIKRIIDYWVIVDTGSSDGTEKIIVEFLRDIPGELHQRPWVNFAHNRNEALHLAKNKGDYVLFVDADEEFVFSPDFVLPHLEQDYYLIKHELKGRYDFYKISLINNYLDWYWAGVIHEGIEHAHLKKLKGQLLSNVINIYHDKGGNRASDPQKTIKDAAILEKAIEENPDNSRYVFYLAQTYYESRLYSDALKVYEKRVLMDGCEQERFWSLYRIGSIQEFHLKMSPAIYLESYKKAYIDRPNRIEPLYYIAYYFLNHQKYLIHYRLLKLALALPYPKDTLTVERWMYDWGIDYQLHQSAYHIGFQQEAYQRLKNVLANPNLPLNYRKSLEESWKIAT